MNNGKRFDVCLMNPPYGSVGGDTLHLKFVDKILDGADMQVVVMPFGFVTKNTRSFKKYKDKFSNYLLNIEEVDSRIFVGTGMGSVGIYEFLNDKDSNDNIHISYLDGHEYTTKKIEDVDYFNNYEKNITNVLSVNGQIAMSWAGGHRQNKKNLLAKYPNIHENEIKEKINQEIIKNCAHLKNYNSDVFITCNCNNGGMNGKFISGRTGKILDFKELCNEMLNVQVSNGYNIIIMKNSKSAENCLAALKRPLLRFTCYKTQEDQSMPARKCYKYVPNIDWEDDRVLTDEGLLEVCGCPKDKAKEYAEYCKKYIEENVDN